MSRSRPRFGLLLLFALLAAVAPATVAAQSSNTSAIRGTVVRSDGTPLPEATVQLRHQETGARRSALTNAEGRFLLLLLQPGGPYSVTISHLGYSEATQEGIRLQVGQTETLEFVLEEEAVEVEGVTVVAERDEVFNPSQVGPSTKLDEVTVEAVPILSRDFMDLAVLSPLVKQTESGGFSVLGQNDRYNAILVDGLSSKDAFGASASGVPGGQAGAKILPLDAVAQYEVLVAPYDVRLSGFSGGVMNAVTRTGTNDWRLRAHAVHRTESLIGDLTLPTGTVEASGVDRSLFALSVGGPIKRNVAHFFVSGEFESRHQPPSGYNLFRDDPYLVRITDERVGEFQDLFEGMYGLETGTAGPYPLGQDLANVFARLDWNINQRHRLTVRNVFASASTDQTPNRSPFEPYELSSNAVFLESQSNSTSIQLFSDFSANYANELNVELRYSSDRATPATDYPQVEVDLTSKVEDRSLRRPLRVGSQYFAHDSDLEQTSVRVTNTGTFTRDNNQISLGVTAAYYDIDNRYLPGADGEWMFLNLDDLAINAPERYQRSVLAPGQDPTVKIRVAEWGLLLQDQMDAGKGLTMRFGIRLDVPHVLDHPDENPDILDFFGYSTANLPSGTFLLSPRWGFNWQSDSELRTQVRGGAGLFAGQIPFVWLANAFHNNGLRSVTQVCTGRWYIEPVPLPTAPEFVPNGPLPETCLNGNPLELRPVVIFSEDFRYPQNFRFSAAVDQDLTPGINASFGFLFNHALHQVVLEDLNLGDPSGNQGSLRGYGALERRLFGRASDDGFDPNPELPGYSQVLLATNENRDWAFSLTAELRGRLTDRLNFQTGYTFSRSYDKMSLTFNDMISNMGFNPISQSPNLPDLAVSDFDRPHKFVATIFGTPFPGLEDTHVSLLYTGQSGVPYSYVYRGDLNGDGYPGPGAAFDRTNDLLYVPEDVFELPSGIGTYQLLNDAIEGQECLRDAQGRIMLRNSCRSPWQHRLDLRMGQTVWMGDTEVRLEADMINLLNFLNSEWGTVQTIRPEVSLLEPIRRSPDGQTLTSVWAGGALPSQTEDGELRAPDSWTAQTPDSQWQAQFGVRVTFGGSRR